MKRWWALERTLIVGLGLVIVGGLLSWVLPEILRRLALEQIARHTGRPAAIEDVDLNLFTRRLRFTHLRLAERQGTQAFVEVERIDARLVLTALWHRDIHLTEVVLVAPVVRLVRTGPGQFNVSDLVRRSAAPSDGAPRRWSITVDRLTIAGGTVRARDEAVAPPAEWQLRALHLEARDLTTRPNAGPGHGAAQAWIDEARLDVVAETLRLVPLATVVKVTLDGFDLGRLGPYTAHADTPFRTRGGRLGAALTATVDHEGAVLTRAGLAGTVTVDGEALARTNEEDPFLDISRVDVAVKEVDAITRSVTLSSVAVASTALRARRDAGGVVDLVEMFETAATGARTPRAEAPSPPEAVPRRLFPVLLALGHGFEHVHVERVTLGPSTVAFRDEAVRPAHTLALTGMQATLTDLSWPPQGPAELALSAALPGGGTLRVSGPVRPRPLEATLAVHVRNAPVRPYQIYIPGPGQFRGRCSGDSRVRITRGDGRFRFASRGTGWAEGVEVWGPGDRRPAMSVERMDLVGIDFEWPVRARVAKATFRRPRLEIVREADRSLDVVTLFTPPARPEGASVQPAASPRSRAPRREKPPDVLQTMRLDFEAIRIEDGFARFLDRTTRPAFSKDLSRLTVAVDHLGNRPGQPARVAVHAIIGGDATLDVHGELGPIGAPVFVDLLGELHSLSLATFNPYVEPALGWIIERGALQYTTRFVLDGPTLDASNDVVVGQLQVAPASGREEVQRRLGLPLDSIVALATDGRGEIRLSVPVAGSLQNPQFDLREVLWTAIRRALAGLVRAPFRAISHSRRNGDTIEKPAVDPVIFAAGSAVITPDMEAYLLRVADVLRRAPLVNLALTPAIGAGDVQALGTEALLDDLGRRRVDAARAQLVAVEGIPAERLRITTPTPEMAQVPADAAGRVELEIVAGPEEAIEGKPPP